MRLAMARKAKPNWLSKGRLTRTLQALIGAGSITLLLALVGAILYARWPEFRRRVD